MILTSVIKTQSRILEKKIYLLENNIANIKNEIHEAQLDYYYLSSPEFISNKIKEYSNENYNSIEFEFIKDILSIFCINTLSVVLKDDNNCSFTTKFTILPVLKLFQDNLRE